MHLPEDAILLRIFIGESDRYQNQPLYQAIVLKARELELAGATVLRGPMGFGKSSHLHTAKILRLSMDLPIVIEIVDTEEKVNAFLPVLDEMMGGGLVTLERAKVIRYQDQKKDNLQLSRMESSRSWRSSTTFAIRCILEIARYSR
jgi:uncharacterized protein